MSLSPPNPAVQGQPYIVLLNWYNEESGVLTDPASVQAEFTYGSEAPLVPDVAGPYIWDGSSSTPASGAVWRTGTGQLAAWWDVPATQPGGAYVVTWTVVYEGDTYLVTENFPVQQIAVLPVISGDTGYWTGSIIYQPPWSAVPLSIPLGETDSNGVTWLLQSVKGWDSPPSAVGQVIQRSADHGGYATAQYYGPRIITLTVMASAPTQALRDQARAQMQQAVPVSDLAVFQYNEPVPKLAYVRRNATAQVGEDCPTLVDVTFTVPLVAPDPRKYATTAQSASSQTSVSLTPLSLPFSSGFPVSFPPAAPPGTQGITAVNSGTIETRPVLTVQGPVTGPAIVNGATGQAVSFSGLALGASDTMVMNMDARQAYVNGVFQPADASSSWWVLEPGTATIYMTGTGSSGSVLSADWSSAWI